MDALIARFEPTIELPPRARMRSRVLILSSLLLTASASAFGLL